MNSRLLPVIRITILLLASCSLFSFHLDAPSSKPHYSFPYKKAGLTEREAAAHLLNRFTFGATPGAVDEVVKMGLEKWFEQQLSGGLNDDSVNLKLSGYDALKMTNAEIATHFPRPAQALKMAIADGIIKKDSVKLDKKEYRQQLAEYMKQKGLKPQQELFRQFINQKILRAAYSNNQLQEVLTDFWFNHFNVSITKNDCAEFIPAYERDVIRPNVTGKFENLLIATAKSPAMLLYLDNFLSAGENTNANVPGNDLLKNLLNARQRQLKDTSSKLAQNIKNLQKARKNQGLNENYAREVMELHTLGVDGGYTQSDVTQAAKVLTGWTIFPMGEGGYGGAIRKLIDKVGEDKLIQRGFIHDGDFMFAINRHDNTAKTVLGTSFPSNGGYDEGLKLMDMLAHHPSTAKFITRKLAVHFVSDNPPQSLLDKMAKTFTEKNGDIKEVMITMASSPEFWDKKAVREKTKSPFELAISAIRAVNVNLQQPYQVFQWVDKMGQKIYFYQAPTGFPDKAQYWINTGALLNRMNFGLAVASQRIPGEQLDLLALNNHHEPESALAALNIYGKIIMPERNLDQTIKQLTPMLNDPDLVSKIDAAAGKTTLAQPVSMVNSDDVVMNDEPAKDKKPKEKVNKKLNNNRPLQQLAGNNSMLSQVVGILIGSPEFQRK